MEDNKEIVYDDYLGLSKAVSIILAVIPFTSWFLGVFIRFKEKKVFYAIVRIFLGFNILWFLDLLFIIVHKSLFRMPD